MQSQGRRKKRTEVGQGKIERQGIGYGSGHYKTMNYEGAQPVAQTKASAK